MASKKAPDVSRCRQSSTRRLAGFLLGIGLILALGLIYIYTQGRPSSESLGNLQPGMASPDFTLGAVRGGTYRLAELRGQVILFSFLNTQADPTQSTLDPSRSQIVFLKSMEQQYDSKGVRVLIVDATHLQVGKRPGQDELINFAYDWSLETIPVLVDDRSGSTAREYGVSQLPTTFLIRADGVVDQRWDGFASAPQLAFALQALVGPPVFATSTDDASRTQIPAEGSASVACAATPARAQFAGLPPARPLSENIWVVDEGKPWESGRPWYLRWIVLGGEGKLHLQVTAHDLDSDESLLLADESMSPLPEDESQGLLVSWPDSPPNVYLLLTSVVLDGPGCLQVEAVVTQVGEVIPLSSGQMLVPVR